MNNDLNQQLNRLLEDFDQIKDSLKSVNLEPANLNWDDFLDKIPILSKQFQDIITNKSISMLKYYVVYPTKPDSPDQRINIDSLLCANDISALNSESQTCKKRYQEVIKDLGFENTPPAERKNILESQIRDHNMFCQNAYEMAEEIIKQENLTQKKNKYISTPKVKPPPFDSIYAMLNGHRDLPVPQHILSKQ